MLRSDGSNESSAAERKLAKLRRLKDLRAERERRVVAEVAARYAHDPAGWVAERLTEHLWSKQVEITEAVRDNRYTAVQSCHDVGKSFVAARLAAWWLAVHQAGDAFVVTTAPTDTQVKAVLWREIRKAHRKAALPGRITLEAHWLINEELVALGRKPADYDPSAFQGIHARYVLVIIDEACGVSKALFEAVDTLVTNVDARVLAIGNPDDPASYFAEVCKPGSGWRNIRIDAFDSPNFTDEPIPEELGPLLLSQEWVEERKKRWGESSPLYTSKVRGEFPDISDDTLISPKLILAAQHRWEQPDRIRVQPQVLGVDVARFGADETVIYGRFGTTAELLHMGHKADTMTTTGHVVREADAISTLTPIHVDEVGVGAGVVDRLSELGYQVVGLNGGSSPADSQHFFNARAEWYWGLRQRFEDGDIAINPDDEDLAAQLVAIKWKPNSRGQVVVESKDDMRKRGLPSPDRADGLVYAFVEPMVGAVAIEDSREAPTITGDVMRVGF